MGIKDKVHHCLQLRLHVRGHRVHVYRTQQHFTGFSLYDIMYWYHTVWIYRDPSSNNNSQYFRIQQWLSAVIYWHSALIFLQAAVSTPFPHQCVSLDFSVVIGPLTEEPGAAPRCSSVPWRSDLPGGKVYEFIIKFGRRERPVIYCSAQTPMIWFLSGLILTHPPRRRLGGVKEYHSVRWNHVSAVALGTRRRPAGHVPLFLSRGFWSLLFLWWKRCSKRLFCCFFARFLAPARLNRSHLAN